jgi:hypothetical protein
MEDIFGGKTDLITVDDIKAMVSEEEFEEAKKKLEAEEE